MSAQDRSGRVVVFLDIDGVIAPFRVSRLSQAVVIGFEDHGSLVLDPVLNERLVRLCADPRIEPRWLTSWEDDANRLLAPRIGMPDLVTHRYVSEASGWWKAAVVDAELAGDPDVRCVFIDDEVDDAQDGFGPNAKQTLEQRWGDRLLVVSPNPFNGLSIFDVDEIETFAVGHSTGS